MSLGCALQCLDVKGRSCPSSPALLDALVEAFPKLEGESRLRALNALLRQDRTPSLEALQNAASVMTKVNTLSLSIAKALQVNGYFKSRTNSQLLHDMSSNNEAMALFSLGELILRNQEGDLPAMSTLARDIKHADALKLMELRHATVAYNRYNHPMYKGLPASFFEEAAAMQSVRKTSMVKR